MRLGPLWNKLANPKNIPRLFAFALGVILVMGFVVPMELNPDQIYPRPEPQSQISELVPTAPYARGGEVLVEPGITMAEYPENAASLGMITAYMSPLALWVASITPYFGTSIYSSPGGLIDEILYYTRGFDTILESSILMMSFVISSWLCINYTLNRKNEASEIKDDVKKAIDNSQKIASEIEENDSKARKKQMRRDN